MTPAIPSHEETLVAKLYDLRARAGIEIDARRLELTLRDIQVGDDIYAVLMHIFIDLRTLETMKPPQRICAR